MDPRLLRHYEEELRHLRELGQEFAQEHPKVGGRLGLESLEVADPYVERLLEGFAFLSARVRLKLDAEHPRLIAQLLESLYPNFLAPVPSMMMVRFAVDASDPNLAAGYPLPRGSALHASAPRGQGTRCEFRTGAAITLWPLTLEQVRLSAPSPDLALARWPGTRPAQAVLRLRLRVGGGLRAADLKLDRLALYISAPNDTALRLHELVLGSALGSLVLEPGSGAMPATSQFHDASSIQPLGFDADEALLPESLRAFSAHRLIQEYAAMPQRLLRFEVTGLAPRLAALTGNRIDIVLPLARADASLEPLVDADSLALHCAPAINLFPKRLDRIALAPGYWEHHLVPDRTRPMDYEVHSLTSLHGYGQSMEGSVAFEPLYTWRRGTQPGTPPGWYTLRREARLPSERQRLHGARVPSYLGQEVFVSLLDPGHGAYRSALRQLSAQALVTNRDLPVLLPQGEAAGAQAWQLTNPGPVAAVHCLHGPTRPHTRQPIGELGWQLVTQLTRNHLSLLDEGHDGSANAQVLRELLTVLGPAQDAAWQRQCQGVLSLLAQRVVRRLPYPGPLSFGCGVGLNLTLDDDAFGGASAFLLASVVDHLLARHASINSFTELTWTSPQRGAVVHWPPRVGQGVTV